MPQRPRRPVLARQRLQVQLNQQPPRVQPATLRQLTQRRRRAHLPRVAVHKNRNSLVDFGGHAQPFFTVLARTMISTGRVRGSAAWPFCNSSASRTAVSPISVCGTRTVVSGMR